MPRHFQWPLKVSATGQLATNEQDSDADVATSIAVILSYPRGGRIDNPGFGLPIEALRVGGPDLQEIRAAVLASEPRADAEVHLADDRLLRGIANVEVGFAPKQAPAS
jgi:hypothetical protein